MLFVGCGSTASKLKTAHQPCGGKMTDTDDKPSEEQTDLSENTKPEVVLYDAWDRRFKDKDKYSHGTV